MIFTDENLRQFKEEIPLSNMYGRLLIKNAGRPDFDLSALIHRLECAEAYAEFRLRFSSGHDGENQVLDKWLASKGVKEGA